MGYRFPKTTMDDLIKEDKILFGEDDTKIIELKLYAHEYSEKLSSVIEFDGRIGSYDLKELFTDSKRLFTNPKPVKFINEFIPFVLKENDTILDFYGGSGTTAHAVFSLNAEDEGNRKFILVQLQEPTDPESEAFKAGYKTISEITKERIRLAGEKVKTELNIHLFSKPTSSLDIGFRVFKLDSSNINAWDGSVQNFEQNLLSAAENIKPDRTEEDVLYEILLKSGLDLAQPIEEKIIAGKKVFNIGLGALFICLSNDLTTTVAEGIGHWKQKLEPSTCRVIFKDTGFNDVEKTNSIQILRRYGINEVNTI
jgi:adenine-specific DNA-methyltransferase